MRRALLSVFDKQGLAELGRTLVRLGFELVSTGGTSACLRDHQLPVTSVESVTGLPEMLGGRVKTLHPALHAGILARRQDPQHVETLERSGFQPIDLVVVNLYPFRQTVSLPDCTREQGIEQIDIGGPALLRSAAKNHADVLVVVDPADYREVALALEQGETTPDLRLKLAAKAFAHTAAYDAAVAQWLAPAPQPLAVLLTDPEPLRYGENPHQAALRYLDANAVLVKQANWRFHQGKELSYNNLVDADAAWALVADLPVERAAAVVVKHANPCGVGSTPGTLARAIARAVAADPVSAFGGILAVNRPFDLEAADFLADRFLEVVLAPSFTPEALQRLSRKPNLRVVAMGPADPDAVRRVLQVTRLGVLLQTPDTALLDLSQARVVTDVTPTPVQWQALDLAWRVVKHVKSNAIVIGDETGTLGVGAGQMSRVDSAAIAADKAAQFPEGLRVAASDAFFPFPDGVETLARAGVRAIVQPGGSKKDPEVVAAAQDLGIAMVLTGTRHFRH
jgi:phosphoribosylaminoimidazolecarboxamide formyltransferase/IMP cyclohydrolase